ATGDVVSHDRVVIAGNILLNSDNPPIEYVAGELTVPCDALCAALLDTPGVSTVTIRADLSRRAVKPTTYRLVPRGEAGSRSMTPKSPERILQYLPEKPASDDARIAQEKAIIARWVLRLASEVTLTMVPSPQHHDLTITMTSTTSQGRFPVSVTQVDVRD